MRRKIITAIVATVTALAVGGTIGVYQALDKTVTLTIDGQPQQVNTMSRSVGSLLAEQGIEPGEHDQVAPALDTPLNDGTRISVRYGRPVTITLDGRTATHWTTGTSVGEVLDILKIKSAGADMSASRSRAVGREGFELTVDTAKTITVIVGGKPQQKETTATTVGAAITDLSLKVDADDIVQPSTVTALADGATIKVIKVDNLTEKKTEKVAFKTIEKKDSGLDRGTTKVEQAGKSGERTITYKVVKHDGKLYARSVAKDAVTTEPVTKVVRVGTRKPAPPPAPKKKSTSRSGGSSDSGSSDSGSGGGSDAPPVSSGSVWDRLAQCESGGNWSINTGNGYYGGLQFSASSWRAVGGSGLPHQHSREEQIRRAEILKSKQGWGAWPACTRKLGIR
ncbi:ubiquitin-like domain-containing protein [Enemella sp. A6]|uniref:ubiquitin-like domain-containing protein n=1 Tax=Enemella sp. A6 TaxID=3440152 RepID=UPI003EBB95A9